MKQLSLAALLLFSTLAACKKDDDVPVIPTPTCRIATATFFDGSDSTRISLTYDGNGRLISSSQDGDVINFTYSGSTIYANNSGSIDTITVNSSGLVTEQRSTQDQGGGSVYSNRTTHTYNGNEVQQSVYMYSYTSGGTTFGDTTVTTYTWSGGNRISETSDGFTTTYEFSDRAVPASGGDVISFLSDYIYTGAHVVRNKNLTTRLLSGGSDDLTLTYQYDAAGKIASALITGTGFSGFIRYTYLCQ